MDNLKNKLLLEAPGGVPCGLQQGAAGGGEEAGSNGERARARDFFPAKWGLGRVGGREGEGSMPQGACFSDLRHLNYKF